MLADFDPVAAIAAALHASGVHCDWNPVGHATIECESSDHQTDAAAILASLDVDLLPKGSLDAAWREAEAALPDGWGYRLHRWSDGSYGTYAYSVNAKHVAKARSDGDTPAEALRALVAKLAAQ